MGNSNQSTDDQLQFIQQLDDRHFGEADIYRDADGRFIMKLKRTSILGDPSQIEFQKIVEWVLKLGDSMIVPILHIDRHQQKGMCIQYEVAHILTEYYNYTLKDLSENKKELVEEAELWCVLEGLLRLTTTLRKNKLGAKLDMDNVFLTLKGTPCVYIYHLVSFQDSINFNQNGMGQMVGRILLQLATGQKIGQTERQEQGKQLLGLLSKVCSRYKCLGKLIKQLINRQKSEEDILTEITSLILANKVKKAHGVKLNRFKYLIPTKLQIIEQKPQKDIHPDSENLKSIKKSNSFKEIQSIKSQSSKNGSSVQRKSKQSTDKKSALMSLSSNKQNDMLFSKQDASKLLTELQKKKEENRLQMQRLLMKKQSLMHSSQQDKQHKQNIPSVSTEIQKRLKKNTNCKQDRGRRITQMSQGSRRR